MLWKKIYWKFCSLIFVFIQNFVPSRIPLCLTGCERYWWLIECHYYTYLLALPSFQRANTFWNQRAVFTHIIVSSKVIMTGKKIIRMSTEEVLCWCWVIFQHNTQACMLLGSIIRFFSFFLHSYLHEKHLLFMESKYVFFDELPYCFLLGGSHKLKVHAFITQHIAEWNKIKIHSELSYAHTPYAVVLSKLK